MSDIIVKFKPMGQKQLIDAINRLEAAQGKATTTAKKHRLAIGRNRKSMAMFEQSLATVRSRLLVFNFAMGMGIRQLIQFSQQAARVQDMSRAFTTLSGTGENASLAVNKISRAVKGTMSQMDLFKQSNNAMILGVTRNTDEMAEMFKIAQTLGAALGVDTAHAVESLITGIGRQSRLMLDNIGIIVKSDDAYKNYAAQLNKTVDQLTDAEKKQAFFTAAMESARTKANELGNQQLTARDQFNKFNSTLEDFTNFIGDKSTPVVLDFFNSFGESLKRITETDLETSIRKLEELGVSAERLADLNRVLGLQEARKQIKQSQKDISESLEQIVMRFDEEKIEGFGVQVDKIQTSMGILSGAPEFDFKFDISKISAESLNKELDQLLINSESAAFLLTKATAGSEFAKMLDQEIINNAELFKIYNELLNQINLMNEANETLTGTNEDVVETNEDIAGSGDKITASLKNQMSAVKSAAKGFAALGKELGMGAKAIAAIQAVGALANAHSAASDVLADKTVQPTALRIAAAAGMYAEGFAHVLAIRNAGAKLGSGGSEGGGSAPILSFEQGGYVGGNRHSQGGTIIEAERGEFVMSRNAVDSIGLETLNQMNQGGGVSGNINVTVTGNVMTQDFVEGELAESIKEALRRGTDFGIDEHVHIPFRKGIR
tara:strand:- start:179 stop:2167 length:1989 start_codon:yes stop_codon:yes gene_type:complete